MNKVELKALHQPNGEDSTTYNTGARNQRDADQKVLNKELALKDEEIARLKEQDKLRALEIHNSILTAKQAYKRGSEKAIAEALALHNSGQIHDDAPLWGIAQKVILEERSDEESQGGAEDLYILPTTLSPFATLRVTGMGHWVVKNSSPAHLARGVLDSREECGRLGRYIKRLLGRAGQSHPNP